MDVLDQDGLTPSIPSPHHDITPVKRVLHFFWLIDWSGSMYGPKMASLNHAIREAIPEIEKAVRNQPNVQIMMRAIRFSDCAQWHIGPDPVPFEQFEWIDLEASGLTATAQAIGILTDELSAEKMIRRGLPPVAILVSDGFCTDPDWEYDQAIDKINSIPWGKKAIRMAIAVGKDSEYDEKELSKFINPPPPKIPLLKARHIDQLTTYIKWASTVAVNQASQLKPGINDSQGIIGDIPDVPEVMDTDDASRIF